MLKGEDYHYKPWELYDGGAQGVIERMSAGGCRGRPSRRRECTVGNCAAVQQTSEGEGVLNCWQWWCAMQPGICVLILFVSHNFMDPSKTLSGHTGGQCVLLPKAPTRQKGDPPYSNDYTSARQY